MVVPQIQYIDRAVDIQVVQGRWWFPFYEELHVCVPEACNVRIVIAAILKKKLALMFESLDELKEMSSDR